MSGAQEWNGNGNGTGSAAGVQELRERIAEERRELTETVSALHAKADIVGRAREKVTEVTEATDAELADAASRAGHAAAVVGRLGRQAVTTTVDRVATTVDRVREATPEPVRTRAERAAELLRREARLVAAASAVLVVTVALRLWRGARTSRWAPAARRR